MKEQLLAKIAVCNRLLKTAEHIADYEACQKLHDELCQLYRLLVLDSKQTPDGCILD